MSTTLLERPSQTREAVTHVPFSDADGWLFTLTLADSGDVVKLADREGWAFHYASSGDMTTVTEVSPDGTRTTYSYTTEAPETKN